MSSDLVKPAISTAHVYSAYTSPNQLESLHPRLPLFLFAAFLSCLAGAHPLTAVYEKVRTPCGLAHRTQPLCEAAATPAPFYRRANRFGEVRPPVPSVCLISAPTTEPSVGPTLSGCPICICWMNKYKPNPEKNKPRGCCSFPCRVPVRSLWGRHPPPQASPRGNRVGSMARWRKAGLVNRFAPTGAGGSRGRL